MKVATILNIGVTATFLIVVGTVSLIATREWGVPKPGKLMELGSVPDFRLVESSGAERARADLVGKVWIASFIFTRCAEECPAMMRAEVKLQRNLPVREDLILVSFSVDPDYDTPERLRAYAEMFGADRSRWWFFTGDKKSIYRLAIEGFRLSTMEADPENEMPILHSSKLVLVDRRGTIRGYYDSMDEMELRQLVRDARRLLAERT
ncbi:MAG: SCO family protein [Verrucomicrobiae bacterium]|nr:SCO family protein [Verrucomicrobiae bacterium]